MLKIWDFWYAEYDLRVKYCMCAIKDSTSGGIMDTYSDISPVALWDTFYCNKIIFLRTYLSH